MTLTRNLKGRRKMGKVTVEVEFSDTGNWLKTYHDGNLINLSPMGEKPMMCISVLGGCLTATLPAEDFGIRDSRRKEDRNAGGTSEDVSQQG